MPRRVVLSAKEINRRRGTSWEFHYNNRRQVSCMLERERVARIIAREVPAPKMRIDGSLLEGMVHVQGVFRVMLDLGLDYQYRDLMCVWYWSEAGWDEFVRLFQSLPEVDEDYYLFYDVEQDATLILPVAGKPKKGSKGVSTTQVQPRYKSGTTGRLVPENGGLA